jgi:type IV secretion system protein VirD4
MKFLPKLLRLIFLNPLSIILLTPIFSIAFVYIAMDLAMQWARSLTYDIPWFTVWFYSPKEIMSQMTYFQSINNYQIYDQASMQAAAKGKMILLGILMASTFLGVYIFIYRYKSLGTSQSDRHGNSRWADIEEMRKKGLIDGEGVVIGRMCHWWRNYYITHDGSEPIVGIGPTRSGKGLGWVITTLLRWLHSTFVYDPKGENWRLTAWFRKNILKHKCLRFAPNELPGASKYTNARFNPLEEINYGTLEEVSQAQSLATIITDRGEFKRDYWERDAATTIQGVILNI